jgi:hypothetical protein
MSLLNQSEGNDDTNQEVNAVNIPNSVGIEPEVKVFWMFLMLKKEKDEKELVGQFKNGLTSQ